MRTVHTVVLGTFLLAGTTAQAQSVRILAPLEGYQDADVTGMSSNGHYVVGRSYILDPYKETTTLWDQFRKPHELVGLCYAFGVSDDAGVIVGSDCRGHAIILTPSGVVNLGTGTADVVNAQGTVVAGVFAPGSSRPYCYLVSSETLIDLLPAEGDDYSSIEGINDAGTLIAGTTGSSISGEYRACVWSSAGGPPPVVLDSPRHQSHGWGVSADGSVVIGDAKSSTGGFAAARWVDGQMEFIGSDNTFGADSVARDISDDGTLILGSVLQGDSTWNWGFLFDTTHRLRSVYRMLIDANVDISGLGAVDVGHMSSDGRRIAGLGWTAGHLTIALEIILETDCAADFNADFVADFFDYLDFVALYDVQDPRADLNGDSTVDFFDYLDFVAAFGAGCE
jgi:uncharacterized membrane protein